MKKRKQNKIHLMEVWDLIQHQVDNVKVEGPWDMPHKWHNNVWPILVYELRDSNEET